MFKHMMNPILPTAKLHDLLDCIYLHPLSNAQGSHELFHLTMVLPIPISVIAAVNELAAAEGMKGLCMKKKSGHILNDSAWIAGVDYDDAKDNEEDDDDEDAQGNIAKILADDDDPIKAKPNAREEEELPVNADNANFDDGDEEETANGEEEEREAEEFQEPPPPWQSTRVSKPTAQYLEFMA
jgi:hypothetical protein